MASLTAMREGLAANLDAIPTLQVSPYLLAAPTPPSAEVAPAETEYDLAGSRGLDRWRFTVRVFVAHTTDKGAQKKLDSYLETSGPHSVKAALEADSTLGGACDDLRVIRASGYRVYGPEGRASVLGAEWDVDVLAIG